MIINKVLNILRKVDKIDTQTLFGHYSSKYVWQQLFEIYRKQGGWKSKKEIMEEHKQKVDPKSFTSRYNVDKLVYYELFDNPNNAIAREKQIKGWVRKKKIALIKSFNPDFKDLSNEL